MAWERLDWEKELLAAAQDLEQVRWVLEALALAEPALVRSVLELLLQTQRRCIRGNAPKSIRCAPIRHK